MRTKRWACLVVAAAALVGAAPAGASTSYDTRYYWKDNLTIFGWAETSWVTDNHGDGGLETRVYCVDAIAPYDDYWSTSGVVREPGIWAKTPNCGGFTTATFAQAREAVPTGAPWGPWGTFDARKTLTAATTAVPRVATAPTADYTMSSPCSGSYCTVTISIDSNPDAYNIRAWMICVPSNNIHYGGWHTSGTSTAGCGTNGGHGFDAGFQYDKTHQYQVVCWIVGGPRSGSC
jgi:hypothetical protein